MSALRTLISAVCILGAAVLIAWWAIASVVLSQIEDGSAIRGITERALDSPQVRASISADLSGRASQALAERGLDVRVLGLDDELDSAVAQAVDTDAFRVTVLDQVDDAHAQVTEQLTDSLREPAPLTVTMDATDSLNSRIDELGGFAGAVPDVSVPPITIEVLDAAQFEQTRTAYERTVWAQTWGLWLGLALLAFGALVSHRRRWFLAKVLGAIGVCCLGFGASVTVLGTDTVTTFMPGGVDGSLATLWRDVLTAEAVPVVVERSLWVGGIALGAAIVATVLGAALGGRRR